MVSKRNLQRHTSDGGTLSVGEAADYLEVSPRTLMRWIKKGILEPVKGPVGRGIPYKFDREALINLKRNRLGGNSDIDDKKSAIMLFCARLVWESGRDVREWKERTFLDLVLWPEPLNKMPTDFRSLPDRAMGTMKKRSYECIDDREKLYQQRVTWLRAHDWANKISKYLDNQSMDFLTAIFMAAGNRKLRLKKETHRSLGLAKDLIEVLDECIGKEASKHNLRTMDERWKLRSFIEGWSFNNPNNPDDEDTVKGMLKKYLPIDNYISLEKFLKLLKLYARWLGKMRERESSFSKPPSSAAVAERMQISKMHASRIKRRILEKCPMDLLSYFGAFFQASKDRQQLSDFDQNTGLIAPLAPDLPEVRDDPDQDDEAFLEYLFSFRG